MTPIKPPWEVERALLTKAETQTDPKYGVVPGERGLENYIRLGVVNIDKPSGPSSHEVTAWVKKILGVGHAGHGGTLESSLRKEL